MTVINKIFSQSFFRFLLVGGLNTAFGYGSFVLLLYLGLHYILAALLATIFGVLFNFQTLGRLVFAKYHYSLFFRFLAVYGITYLFNVFGIFLFSLSSISNYVAGAILVIPSALLSFGLNKYFVFTAH